VTNVTLIFEVFSEIEFTSFLDKIAKKYPEKINTFKNFTYENKFNHIKIIKNSKVKVQFFTVILVEIKTIQYGNMWVHKDSCMSPEDV
jgi:hypothetical protein